LDSGKLRFLLAGTGAFYKITWVLYKNEYQFNMGFLPRIHVKTIHLIKEFINILNKAQTFKNQQSTAIGSRKGYKNTSFQVLLII
jgi:hypothetical protein